MQRILKSHCEKGHERTLENTYAHTSKTTGRRTRTCIVCKRERQGQTARLAPVDAFWAKVDKTPGHGPKGDCWVWTGCKLPHGYGSFGQHTRAHRYSYELHNGALKGPLEKVCHECDNPSCVNPAHLWVGTQEENALDMSSKGRQWQQKKTHCKSGHEFTLENTYVGKTTKGKPTRFCIACRKKWRQDWADKQLAKQ